MNKLTNDEILSYLSVNQDNRKKVMLHNIKAILSVNELLTDNDISDLRQNSALHDALYNHNCPFDDILNDFYLSHLGIKENSNDVMIWLQVIYS